jgi:aspartate ammonia-lyase
MPGKVNPVIPEVMNQVCFDVIGGDITVTMAAEAGQLQLNAFEPIIAYRLLRSIDELRNACAVRRTRCVVGITANPDQLRRFVEHSSGSSRPLFRRSAPPQRRWREALKVARGLRRGAGRSLSREQLTRY